MATGFWRSRVCRWMLVLGMSLGSLLGASSRPAFAQEEEPEVALPPLVVVNIAGADRLMGDVNYMFHTIGREDLSQVVNGFLSNVGDLKGLDRKKSLGVMLYFKPGFPPSVDPVGFVPVDNIADLLKTIELGPVRTKKVPGEENRYEIDANDQTLQVKLQGGYAYVSNNADAFDRELPDPGPLTQSLTQRYDIAASVNIEGIPEGLRTIFLDFLRAQTEAEMQQRDDEPEAPYRARKAASMNNLKNIEAIVKDGKSLVIGVDASQEAKAIVLEFELKAKPSSGLAQNLKKFPGKPSVFANAYSEQIPLAMTGSWNLTDDDQKVFAEFVKAGQAGATEALKKQNLDPTPLEGIVKSLESTVTTGSVDFFMQFVGEPPGKFAIVGGIKIDRTADFATGLEGLIKQLGNLEGVAEMEVNAVTHNGVALHRILGAGNGDPGQRAMFGGMPALYIGAGRGALWFGVGKEGTDEQLKKAMTLVETVPAEPLTPDRIAPFQVVLNLSSWLNLGGDEENQDPQNFPPVPDDPAQARRQAEQRARFQAQQKARSDAAKEAFKPENDRLLIRGRPTQDGFRLRLQFDEGFIKFLGLRAAQQLDQSQL